MTLPEPTSQYSQKTEAERNRILKDADSKSLKRQQDIDLVSGARLILKSPNGSRWSITVSNAGTVSAVAL